MKRRIENRWWSDFLTSRIDCAPLESAIILHPEECKSCHRRHRLDHVVEHFIEAESIAAADAPVLGDSNALFEFVQHHGVKCPACGAHGDTGLAPPKNFNMLFQTSVGPTQHPSHATGTSATYLRPETAQGVYINYKNIMDSMRAKMPYGVGQIGKSFRNEISVSNFLFRTREFDQMELQYFCSPQDSADKYRYWVQYCHQWLLDRGLKPSSVRMTEYFGEDLAHYALATTDIEFRYPFGWGELWGIANRGSYDLECHAKGSGKALQYRDITTNEVYVPHVVEPAVGVGRLMYALLADAYEEETIPPAEEGGKETTRSVLKLHHSVSPYQLAVLPLMKREPLINMAQDIYQQLADVVQCDYDVTGSIGKRYRRQDEIGTPLCVTIDPGSPDDNAVTIRCSDTMQQRRVGVAELIGMKADLSPARVFGS